MGSADIVLLIDALAWPVVILIVVFLLRRPALDLMERAKTVDVKGVKFELREKLETARASAERAAMTVVFSARAVHRPVFQRAGPHASGASPAIERARAELRSNNATVFAVSPGEAVRGEIIASENPGLFLASIFDDLAQDVRGIAKVIEGGSVSYLDAVNILNKNDILTDSMRQVLDALHDARNIAIHDDRQTITVAEAADWSGIAFGLRQRIDQRARMTLDEETIATLDKSSREMASAGLEF